MLLIRLGGGVVAGVLLNKSKAQNAGWMVITTGWALGVLAIAANTAPAESGLAPLLVGFLVWAVGLSLGTPTGYAGNPARDFAPRLAHALLPIPGKGDSDWSYSWIPVMGPALGGTIGAIVYVGLFTR
jgi:glycerol uptake facilitator protein